MAALRESLIRLWQTLRGRRADHDLETELRSHLAMAVEAAQRRGHSPEAAARAARIDAGGVTQTLDALRDQRGFPWLDSLARDSRYALRALRRSPTFTAVALLTLAIGIGANTAVFSVVNGVLLQPLPYPDADRLVAVWHTAPGAPGVASVSGGLRLSLSMYATYAKEKRAFEAVGVWAPQNVTVTGIGEPELVRGVLVTDGTLQALNVPPMAGRWLDSADDKMASDTIMLGYGYWQRRFGGDLSAIGRTLNVGARVRQIIGIMPKGFRVATIEPEVIVPGPIIGNRLMLSGFGFEAIARLKPGMTIADGNADIARMVPIWMRSWPTIPGADPRVYETWRITPALRPLKQDVIGNVGSALWVVMGTIAIVMLIACANVANLLLVRAESRQQELAVRAALGASAGRIVRTLLMESVWLGLLGGTLGVGVAYGGLRALVANAPAGLPRVSDIAIDGWALTFAATVSVVSGLLFGLVPALKYRGPRIAAALHGGRTTSASRDRHRARGALVVAQVSLALVLLVSAGLMTRTVRALRAVEPGFTHPEQLQTMRVMIPGGMMPDIERVTRSLESMADGLSKIPGVSSVAFTTQLPVGGSAPDWDAVIAEGQTLDANAMPPMRLLKYVSPGLFQTLGTRLLAGRDYTWADLYEKHDVVIVSENLARELWGSPAAALGKRIRTLPTTPWREVIGVVQDVHDNGVHVASPTIIYWPALMHSLYAPNTPGGVRNVVFAVRSNAAGTEVLLNSMRQAVWAVNNSLPLASVQTLQDLYERSLARTSFTLVMLTIAGLMALVLGVIGIYGVIAYSVTQRAREIGIRLALGAQPGTLKTMFVRHALGLAFVGVVIGLGASAGLSRLMASLLYGVSPLDPVTFVAVPVVLVAATLLASYLPARRVAAVDPVDALKAE
jgi:putative ABC transport system permease protein